MELAPTITNVDQTYPVPWLSASGLDVTQTITIDPANFDADPDTGDFVDGFLPRGFAFGIVTSGGAYAIYNGAESDGTETCVGLLKDDEPMAAGDGLKTVAMVFHNLVVDNSALPNPLDAGGIADLKTCTFL